MQFFLPCLRFFQWLLFLVLCAAFLTAKPVFADSVCGQSGLTNLPSVNIFMDYLNYFSEVSNGALSSNFEILESTERADRYFVDGCLEINDIDIQAKLSNQNRFFEVLMYLMLPDLTSFTMITLILVGFLFAV